MVQEMVISPVQPKVEDHAGTGRFVRAAALEARGRLAPEQLAMGPDGVGVGNQGVEPDRLSRLCLDSPNAAVTSEQYAPQSACEPDLDTQLDRESGQRPRHGPGASARIPDPFARLHVGDAAKYGGRCVRSRADVLREMIEHLGEPRVGQMRANRPGHRLAWRATRGGRATEMARRCS